MTRAIAQAPRLDLAIRAGREMRPRRKLRPYIMIERDRQTSLTSRFDLERVNSALYGSQVSYTNDGDKLAGKVLRDSVEDIISGGGSGSGGGGSHGWPI